MAQRTINYIDKRSFKGVYNHAVSLFREADRIQTQRWQGIDISGMAGSRMFELMNAVIHVPQVPRTREYLQNDLAPRLNLPWAEDHFLERIQGEPLNPGVQWAKWPWGNKADGSRAKRDADSRVSKFGMVNEGQFNHNYMERYWPKHAGQTYDGARESASAAHPWRDERFGIRAPYGDLNDLIQLLIKEPDTRQAYMPIFFPEDTGEGDGGRKPCTLGYQFIVRDQKLHTYYPMRSCDFYRHWADDVYLTLRLAEHIVGVGRSMVPEVWDRIGLGSFTMHCTSLHIFENDIHQL